VTADAVSYRHRDDKKGSAMHAIARVPVRIGGVLIAVALMFGSLFWSAPSVGAADAHPTDGYFLLDGGGGLYVFDINFAGDGTTPAARCANQSCSSMAVTPSGLGYWILNRVTGHVYPFGTAGFYGEPATRFAGVGSEFVPNMVQIVATPGHGYWVYEVGLSDLGHVDHFGDAGFFGDTTTLVQHNGGHGFNGSAVSMAATPDGKGYWEVRSDGGVFSFGNAKFYGSMGGTHLTQPIVGMTATADGKGYWLVAADGGVFAFGDAVFEGSMGGTRLNAPMVGMIRNPTGSGYWLASADGGVFGFGAVPFVGTAAQFGVPVRPIVAIAARRGATG
jgi:hypothetical protein